MQNKDDAPPRGRGGKVGGGRVNGVTGELKRWSGRVQGLGVGVKRMGTREREVVRKVVA